MTNPNNCATCGFKPNGDGGWCYMFRDEPTDTCAQHTARRLDRQECMRIALAIIRGDRREVSEPSDGE